MGAPKTKWSAEEEAALNAGIAKYGLSKWSKLLRDAEFGKVLEKRSNVDLKDKWRNMNLAASGRTRRPRKERDLIDCMMDSPVILPAPSQIGTSKMPMERLDILILDAIVDLKEKRGSSLAAISKYLQEKHSVPPNVMKQLHEELESLMNCGKLIKVKHRYRIGPSSSCLGPRRSPSSLPLEVKQGCFTNGETSAIKIITKEENDAELDKYGVSKWTKLRDPEFAKVLEKSSNVDLKDKWRNMTLAASGITRSRPKPKQSEMLTIYEPEDLSSPHKERDLIDCMLDSPVILPAASQIGSSKMPMPMERLDILILDAIVDLKEKRGSSRAEISEYLQEKHSVPPNVMKLLQAELKSLMNCGKLIKVKHRYRIGPSSSCSPLPLEVKQGCFLNGETSAIKVLTKEENNAELDKMRSMTPQQAAAIATEVVAEAENTIKVLTKAGIDAELEKMRRMTPQQAAAMAMKAVAEAEAAILEAERAEKAAEAAEADAKRAKIFADAAMGIKPAYPFYMPMATR